MSLALSGAIAATLAARGVHVQQVLTLVAGSLPSMRGVRIDITELSDQLAQSHPNTLLFPDLEDPVDTTGETPARHHGHDNETETGHGEDSMAGASDETRLAGRIAETMSREGRTCMSREETAWHCHSHDRPGRRPGGHRGDRLHGGSSSNSCCPSHSAELHGSQSWRGHGQAEDKPEVRAPLASI